MGDHFWPAVYPGIAVGLIYGLALGGVINAVLGAFGGLIASFMLLVLFGTFFMAEGFLPLATLLVSSIAGAFATTRVASLFRRRSQ